MTTKAEFDAYAQGALVIVSKLDEVPAQAVIGLITYILAMVPDVIASEVAAATPAPAEVQITGSDAPIVPVVIAAPASEAPVADETVVQPVAEVVEVAEQPADPATVEGAPASAVEEPAAVDAPFDAPAVPTAEPDDATAI